jgi:cytochrome c oxidase subunit 2
MRIGVTGFQWGWSFRYAQGRTVTGTSRRIPTLVVPTGEVVLFTGRSRDVVHSFWIPEVRFKRDVFPGFSNRFDLVFDHPGSFAGRCAEFCGLDHAGMDFVVRAVSPAEFRAWLAGGRLE